MNNYDSYKDSGVEWIGEVPSHWKRKRFSYSFNIQKGKIPKELIDVRDDESLPYLSMNVLRGEEPNEFSSGDGLVVVDVNDIGLLWDGSNSGEVIKMNQKGILSSTVSHISLKDRNLTKEFSFYLLKFYEKDFKNNTVGMGIPHVDGDHVKESKTLIPPLSEQQQIVSFLDTKTELIDSLISKTEKKIELLKEKRTSLINEVVTKGLNTNVEMKDSGTEWIREIPISWELTKMKFEVEIFGRIGFRGYTTEDIVNEGEGVITLSPSNIKDDVFNLENRTYLSWEKYDESPEIKIFKDDIILVKTGSTIGKTSIIPDGVPEMTINPQLVVLKNVKLFPKFLYYQTTCKFIKESFDIEQTGSTTPTISQEKVKDFPLVKPPLSEQQQIVEYLDEQTQQIDKTISIEEKRIEYLKEYRQSLIYEVVTGKRKVTDDIFPTQETVTLPERVPNEIHSLSYNDHYLIPDKGLLEFLNSKLTDYVETQLQQKSIVNFFIERYWELSRERLSEDNVEYQFWRISKLDSGSIKSHYYSIQGVSEEMRPDNSVHLIKTDGVIEKCSSVYCGGDSNDSFSIYNQ